MTFNCDHEGTVPSYMGRGMARVKRLDAYFHRPCLDCAVTEYSEYVKTLSKNKAGEHFTVEEQTVKVQAKRAELSKGYVE